MARLFATAFDVAPEAHVRMQAAFQRHVDNGVSKTVNLPRQAKRRGRRRAPTGWRSSSGCKGITVYRDGSREKQVLVSGGVRDGERCPQCDAELAISGGCRTCSHCGWASCETTE